jgi:hypothetical protein
VAGSALGSCIDLFHGDGFGFFPHGRKDSGSVAFAAALAMGFALKYHRPVFSAGIG